jgi:hypothetical protein
MGGIRETFGRIATETRRTSFYVHASYGFSVGRYPVGGLDFDTEFIDPTTGKVCTITAKYRGDVAAYPVDGSCAPGAAYSIPNGTLVAVPGTEEFDGEDPLGRQWHDYPHPEFAYEDLDDLIAALEELRRHRAGDS